MIRQCGRKKKMERRKDRMIRGREDVRKKGEDDRGSGGGRKKGEDDRGSEGGRKKGEYNGRKCAFHLIMIVDQVKQI